MAPHAAVHHVGRRHDVGARPGMGHGRGGQERNRLVVEHALAVHQAAVAMVGVLAQAHVGDDGERGLALLGKGHGLLHDAVFGIGLRATLVFEGRQPEQEDGGNALARHLVEHRPELVEGVVEHAGHGGHGLPRFPVPLHTNSG